MKLLSRRVNTLESQHRKLPSRRPSRICLFI